MALRVCRSTLSDVHGALEDLDKGLAQVKSDLEGLEAQIWTESRRKERLSLASQEMLKGEEERRSLVSQKDELEREVVRLRAELQGRGVRVQTLEEKLQYPSEAQAIARRKELEELVRAHEEGLRRVEGELDRWQAAVDRLEGELSQAKDQLPDGADADNVVEARRDAERSLAGLCQELDGLQRQIERAERDAHRAEELSDTIAQTDRDLRRSLEERQGRETELASQQASVREVSKQVVSLAERLPFASKKEAQARLEELGRQAESMRRAFEEAVSRLQRLSGEVVSLEGQAGELRRQIEELGDLDKEALRQERERLVAEREVLAERKNVLYARLSANESTRERIRASLEKVQDAEAAHVRIENLAQTANGKLSGKERVTLEAYVQRTYFERMLQRANLRMLHMTGGQYEFKRQKSSGNLKSQSGLELEVVDHYNGTTRSARTLSGGESFMAALSLALGLADEIQSNAGGIRIETMFIDEGFGSLDENALQQAVDALQGVTADTKLVGIISHVGELKERIDKQVIVTKKKSGGSVVEVVC